METREGKDGIAGNMVDEAMSLALADPSLRSLIARLTSSILTLRGEASLS
jgi:hypothetical protein